MLSLIADIYYKTCQIYILEKVYKMSKGEIVTCTGKINEHWDIYCQPMNISKHNRFWLL
jgi:hypothetical protein